MPNAVRCAKCGYVYWNDTENWGICNNCGQSNNIILKDGEDQPLLVTSEVIFQVIPYDLERWKHLNPGVKKEKPKKFNRYTALTENQNDI